VQKTKRNAGNDGAAKACLITWLATLPDDAPELARVDLIRRGDAGGVDQRLFTLAEVGREVCKHPTWLHKLRIQEHCGERLAGRFMYRKERVLEFLGSAECQARIAELRAARRAREGRNA
jgi:hypothetical protein